MKNEILTVWLYDQYIGVLEQDNKGRIHFAYDHKLSIPLSLFLPIARTAPTIPFDQPQCNAYFSGLIPEDPHILNPLCHYLKIRSSNTFGILQALGFDCAGAVQFQNEECLKSDSSHSLLSPNERELEKHIKTLVKNPFLLSFLPKPPLLTGKQPKLGIQYRDNQIQWVSEPHLSTHILKCAIGETKTIQNEWLCMTLAQHIGLFTAKVHLKQFRSVLALIVERYDRLIENNTIKRLHQEDFCQALGVMPNRKFQRNKGVCLKDCFDLLSKTAFPAKSRMQFMDRVIFNYLINNTNAHAKKFSLLTDEQGVVSLAPLYGVQCGYASNQYSKTAMKIGNQYEMGAVSAEDWHHLCKDVGYAYPALCKRVQALAEQILIVLPQIRWESKDANLNDELINKLEKNISLQCENALKTFCYD